MAVRIGVFLTLTVLFVAGCRTASSKLSIEPSNPKRMVVPGEIPCSPEKAAHIQTILRRVAHLRESKVPDNITIMTVDRTGLKAFMTTMAEREWTAKDDNQVKALKLFGLIPKEMDLKHWMIEIMVENVAGFFNPISNKVYCMASKKGAGDEVWAHELTHYLDHQRFDLEAMQKAVKEDSDRGLAVDALVEGSATGIMTDFMISKDRAKNATDDSVTAIFTTAMGRKSVEVALKLSLLTMKGKISESPLIIQRMLLFPYQAGLVFRNRLHAHAGNAAVDAAFKKPPESTEQILHPERYHLLGKPDRPHDVGLPKPPKGWTLTVEDTFGMFGLQVLLEQVSGKWFTYLAEGWDGDLFALWNTPKGDVVGWIVVWDYEHQAKRFGDWAAKNFLKTVGGGAIQRNECVVAVAFGPGSTAEHAKWLIDKSRVKARPGDHRPELLVPVPEEQ